MARHEVAIVTDDLSGEQLDAEDHHQIRFSFDGKNRVIDLSAENAEQFRDDMSKWIKASRPDDRKRTNAARPADKSNTTAVREWARANGYEVSDRGRIPADIEAAYNAAN